MHYSAQESEVSRTCGKISFTSSSPESNFLFFSFIPIFNLGLSISFHLGYLLPFRPQPSSCRTTHLHFDCLIRLRFLSLFSFLSLSFSRVTSLAELLWCFFLAWNSSGIERWKRKTEWREYIIYSKVSSL